MPIYEYLCEKCGEFEVTQKITEQPLDGCPTCGQTVKKLISNSTFKLMGTGWYLTDYARKGQSSEGTQQTDSQSKSDGKADTSSDTKSDTKKETSTEQKPANQKGSASTASN